MLALLVAWGALLPAAAPGPARPLFTLWLVLTGLALARRIWRRLTYRIGVRLFLSYLVIGITPFLLMATLAFLLGYMLTGQYAAARLRSTLAGEYERLVQLAHSACNAEFRQVQAVLEEGARQAAERGLTLEWVVRDGERLATNSQRQALDVPVWAEEDPWAGAAVVDGGHAVAAAAVRQGRRAVAVFFPFDAAAVRSLVREQWFEARLVNTGKESAGGFNLQVNVGGKGKEEARPTGSEPRGAPVTNLEVSIGGTRRTERGEVEGGGEPLEVSDREWLDTRIGEGGGLWAGRWVVWFSILPEARGWREEGEGKRIVALLRVSPRGAFQDLFASGSYKLAEDVMTTLKLTGGVLLALYCLAVALAAWMIVTIARSTARLTRGAREVGQGNLAYRIPVKQRDQLGDLAVAFNRMADSVEGMLADVREKERLAQELALAREIQESLLPHTSLRVGTLAVAAHFRPAAEIGGDFFDVIRLPGGSLLVAVGDVAGHGLPTGLHMAMVKAALAALVGEGRRGTDLLDRLNRFLRAGGAARRMVTVAVAEIDTGARQVRLTNAGHPPPFVLAGGEVREVEAASLPLGFSWYDPPASATVSFAPGDLLVLYSDGLVEARPPGGEPFGYEGLRATLLGAAGSTGEGVLGACLAAVEEHLGGAPLPDDVTIVVVEHLVGVDPEQTRHEP
ncbi:MAG: PP2C family protein-serine/threonine phosphatase [Acidobacteriota bacterium]